MSRQCSNYRNHKENKEINENECKFDPFEKYPLYEVKPIKWNPPSSFFVPKKEIEPPEEYVPPPKTPVRDVDYEKLSQSQRKLAGKNLFEKDLEIIREKKAQTPNTKNTKMRNASVTRTKQPPSIYFREEIERQKKIDKLEKYENSLKKKKMKQDLRRRRQFEKEKRHIDEIAAARENIRREQQQFMDETRQNEIKRRQEYIKSLNIEPDKPTRASKLKEEAAKKQLEKVQIENNRQKLNHDIQKVNQKEKAKKINDFIYELNTRKDDEKKLLVKKQALKKKENQWMKWLDLTEQANKTRETMLERIYEQW